MQPTLKQKYKNFFYPKESAKTHYFIMDNFRTIVFALTIALFIRTFFFEPFKIPSTSMVPTLRIGDFLFISKFSYGTKVPFSDVTFNKKGVTVGDVIVFDKDITNSGRTTTYIKRVVAKAGDTIEFRSGKVWLNGNQQDQKFVSKLTYEDKIDDITSKHYIESLGNISHSIIETSEVVIPNISKITVPEGHLVVMGDNRDHSYDSRLWAYPNWGLVKDSEVRGKALFLFFSWDRSLKPRLDRIFNSLVPKTSK